MLVSPAVDVGRTSERDWMSVGGPLKLMLYAMTLVGLLLTPVRAQDPPQAAPSPMSERFCVVPIANGQSSAKSWFAVRRLIGNVLVVPGAAAPIFAHSDRGGTWTITDDRVFRLYDDVFPTHFLDKWLVEPWSGRVVGLSFPWRRVFIRQPAETRFQPAASPPPYTPTQLVGLYSLPKRRLTIAVDAAGYAFRVAGDDLVRWETGDRIRAAGIGPISQLFESPVGDDLIVIESGGKIHIWTARDERWSAGVLRDGSARRVVELRTPDMIVLETTYGLMRRGIHLRNTASTGSPRYVAEAFGGVTSDLGSEYLHVSSLFGEVFRFRTARRTDPFDRLALLTPRGFVDALTVEVSPTADHSRRSPHYYESHAIRRGVFSAPEALFLYDGSRFTKAPDSASAGAWRTVNDLPAIGRAIVSSLSGMSDLSADGRLTAIPPPSDMDRDHGYTLVDWQGSGHAVLATKNRLYLLDRDLNWVTPKTPEGIEYFNGNPVVGAFQRTGELILMARDGLFALVDTARSGSTPCHAASSQGR